MKTSPCAGRVEAGDALDGGGLAGAVGAEQPEAFACGDFKGEVGDGLEVFAGTLAVALGEMDERRAARQCDASASCGPLNGCGADLHPVPCARHDISNRARRLPL